MEQNTTAPQPTRDHTVAVVGLGYIGLPTAVILAQNGLQVIGVDVSDRHVDLVNRGELPFVEEGLQEVLAKVVADGALKAQKETPKADAYIVAVPTPFAEGHKVDLVYIDAAAKALAPQLEGDELVILESTSPPGTTEHMADLIAELRPDLVEDGRLTLDVAHCPERVLPGRIMEELGTNDRVIGGLNPGAAERARDLYASFCTGTLHLTDAATAEMAKLTENSFRDVNIAFANELSLICDELGLDVWELIELANKHPRVNILQPGPGVGGHCIAVDPWFIVSSAPKTSRLIGLARDINDGKPTWVIDQVSQKVEGVEKPVVACLGLAFKKNIDDLRESPAVSIVERLSAQRPDAELLVVEPFVKELPAKLQGLANVSLVDLKDALAKAHVVLLLVDHDVFGEVTLADLRDKEIIDTRGQWRSLLG